MCWWPQPCKSSTGRWALFVCLWNGHEVTRSFRCLDFKSNLKLGLSCVGKMYLVSAVIQNALSCIYGNQTSTFFYFDTPSIAEYSAWF
jgi:hypothetical protein